MDSPTLEHSDSDSGESWTILEHNTAPTEDAPNIIDTPINSEKKKPEIHEKDEDTDGISIISDSDPESASQCQMHYETVYEEELELQHLSQCPFNLAVSDECRDQNERDLFNIDHGKHKTYVHRRNKRLSTVLNIIVLGSVITAAGVAIGHMWGAKSDRAVNIIPNVNNILSNLYKLQEENAYLRNKVKELTALNSKQISQFAGSKHNTKCKKVFEGSLNNDITEKSIKCVDNNVDFSGILHNKHKKQSEVAYENDFKENINTLKNIYLENKNWLDDEIVLRLQQENEAQRRIRKSQHAMKLKKINEEKESRVNPENKVTFKGMGRSSEQDVKPDIPKIITYADSLKSNDMRKEKEYKIKNNTMPYYKNKKNKREKVIESGFNSPLSEEDIIKDTRYVSPKFKQERKKNDRPKSYKKQTRRNKYEQWEMKGGFMKDYDQISVSQDPISNDPHLQEKIEKRCIVINKKSGNNDYITQDCNIKFENTKAPRQNNKDDLFMSNSKLIYHADMKRLEEGLFGEVNPAGWYFRRMHKREQCRAKANNTNQKFAKRNMNYKMKH